MLRQAKDGPCIGAAQDEKLKNHLMLQMKCLSPEVYVADQPIVAISREEIAFLEEKVKLSTRNRTRLCAHQSNEETLHEMFVVYTGSTFMRPNKHPDKDESLHILKGSADFIFFDDDGNVTDVIPLGDAASGKSFYCRVPANVYHTMIMRSERLMIHEVIRGPFRKDTTTVFAPWGPQEDDAAGIREFMARVSPEVDRRLAGNTGSFLHFREPLFLKAAGEGNAEVQKEAKRSRIFA